MSPFQGLNGLGISLLQSKSTMMDTVLSLGVGLTSGTHVAGTIRSDPYGVLTNGKIYAVKVSKVFNIELTFRSLIVRGMGQLRVFLLEYNALMIIIFSEQGILQVVPLPMDFLL
jgi:hypothetical protein